MTFEFVVFLFWTRWVEIYLVFFLTNGVDVYLIFVVLRQWCDQSFFFNNLLNLCFRVKLVSKGLLFRGFVIPKHTNCEYQYLYSFVRKWKRLASFEHNFSLWRLLFRRSIVVSLVVSLEFRYSILTNLPLFFD